MARTISAADDARAVDTALRDLFRTLQTLAIPDSLRTVLDQLEPEPAVGELAGAG